MNLLANFLSWGNVVQKGTMSSPEQAGLNRPSLSGRTLAQDCSRASGAAEDRLCSILAKNVAERRVLVIAGPGSFLMDHLRWMRDCTSGAAVVHSLHHAEAMCSANPEGWVWVVDSDLFDDVDDAVDELIALRAQVPGQVLLLASSEFGVHDLTCRRAAIADASVRLPISRPELAFALSVAVGNHQQIVKRHSVN